MQEFNDEQSRRIDEQIHLMADLRVAQVMTDRQISQLTKDVAELRACVSELRETTFSTLVPILLNHEERMQKSEERLERDEERMEKYEERMERYQQSINAHSKNIEDLYRSQGHLLRRLFGEDLGMSPQG